MTAARLATRYLCPNRDSTGQRSYHDSGEGKPPRKRCRYCKGELFTLTGLWGVFRWAGDGRYPEADALDTYAREARAQASADYLNAEPQARKLVGGRGAVVRWIPKEAA